MGANTGGTHTCFPVVTSHRIIVLSREVVARYFASLEKHALTMVSSCLRNVRHWQWKATRGEREQESEVGSGIPHEGHDLLPCVDVAEGHGGVFIAAGDEGLVVGRDAYALYSRRVACSIVVVVVVVVNSPDSQSVVQIVVFPTG